MNFIDNFEIEHKDVVMKMFIQSIINYARDWYRSMCDASISSWNEFKYMFKQQYGDHSDPKFALNEFKSIQKRSNESFENFNKRFLNIYNKIPNHLKPVDPMWLIFYINAYDPKQNMR